MLCCEKKGASESQKHNFRMIFNLVSVMMMFSSTGLALFCSEENEVEATKIGEHKQLFCSDY